LDSSLHLHSASRSSRRKKQRGDEMKVQNIFRMQAVVIGLGAALFLASSAPAQEIVNTSFNDGPYVASFDQPTATAAAQVTAAAATAANANASAPAVTVSEPVVSNEAVVSLENSAERWLVASSFFGLAMLAVYAFAELRRARSLTQRPSSLLRRAAYN
jgi:hypothetical protein